MKVKTHKVLDALSAVAALGKAIMPAAAAMQVYQLSKEISTLMADYNAVRKATFEKFGCTPDEATGKWVHAEPAKYLAALAAVDELAEVEVDISTPGVTFAQLQGSAFPPGVLSDLDWWIQL